MSKMIIDDKGRKSKIKRKKIFLQEQPSLYSSDDEPKKRITYEIFRTERNLNTVKLWRGKGWKVEKIADEIGVTRQCIYNWLKKYPEFKKKWDESFNEIKIKAERGLFYLTEPHERRTIQVDTYIDKNGDITGRHKRETTTTDPPNFNACKYTLENLASDEYKDKQNVQLSGDISVTAIDIAGILAEARKKAKENDDEK